MLTDWNSSGDELVVLNLQKQQAASVNRYSCASYYFTDLFDLLHISYEEIKICSCHCIYLDEPNPHPLNKFNL